MPAHTLLAWAAVVAWVLCFGLASAAAARARAPRLGLFRADPTDDHASRPNPTLGRIARRAGAVGIVLMLLSKCAGSY